MKNAVRDAIFWIYTPVIPPNIMDYVILNSDVIRGHWRSLGEVTGGQNRSKSKKIGNSPWDAVFYIHSITIPKSIIDYVILSSEIFRGQ